MRLVSRYIARTILSMIGLVVLMLVGLEVFVQFVRELGDIGHGSYGVGTAFFYAVLQVPLQVYLFFPVACLLGSLIGLGLLASHSELIVMRAAGASIQKIVWVVVKVALVLTFIITTFGEFVVPPAVHFAENMKVIAKSNGQALRTARGVWVRSDKDYLHINTINQDGSMQGITRYVLNDKQELIMMQYANTGHYENKAWAVQGITISELKEHEVITRDLKKATWPVHLKPGLLAISGLDPNEMPILRLGKYIKQIKKNKVDASSYELNFWKRIFQPLATIVMMLLAIPFIFGPLRSSTMGSKLVTGAAVGFGFYILNQFFGPFSLVYRIHPIIAAILPTLLFAVAAVYFLKRVR